MYLNANGSRQLIGLCNKIFCFIFRFSPSVSLSLSLSHALLFLKIYKRRHQNNNNNKRFVFCLCCTQEIDGMKACDMHTQKSCMLRIRHGCQTTLESASTSTATATESEAKRVELRLHATPSISQKTVCFDLIKVSTYCYFTCSIPWTG